MSADTAQRVIAVIAKFKKISEDQISLDTSLKDLELDSLDGLNLVFELEEEFNIFIPDDKALTLQNVGEMVEGIDALLADEASSKDAPAKDSAAETDSAKNDELENIPAKTEPAEAGAVEETK